MASYNPYMAGAGGMIGAGAGSMLSDWKNPGDAAMPYFDKMPGTISKYLDPYINAGKNALPKLENEYGRITSNPGGRLNEIGAGYQESPGFKFALQRALQGSNHAAAAGGMAGSPQHEQQNMEIGTGLANQDYNQWLGHALGLYGKGLEGEQDIYNTGAKTGMAAGEDMASILANQAKLAYESANAENQHEGGWMGSLLGGAGTIAGGFFGGPAGAAVGGGAGKEVGGWF